MEDLRPTESTTEQVKVTCVPGHTGGGYVKLPLMAMVTTPVQTVEGRAVTFDVLLCGDKLFMQEQISAWYRQPWKKAASYPIAA